MFLTIKDKEKVDEQFKAVDVSFSTDISVDDAIIYYIHFMNDKKELKFVNILELYQTGEVISINHVLSEQQMDDLLILIDTLMGEEYVEGYVFDAIVKLYAVMSLIYGYDNCRKKIGKYLGQQFDGTSSIAFRDILNGAKQYIADRKKEMDPYLSPEFSEEYREMGFFDDELLSQSTVDLTATEYKNNPAVGRNEEIKDVMVALMQNSCILVGESGVGKTAIAEGVAYKILTGDAPESLIDKRILKISATDIVSGCKYVGELEEKMKRILDEVMYQEDIILFFDEMHTAIGTGKGSEGTLDIANILKPYIDRGQIKIIGATTKDEYEEHIGNDPAFKRRFEKIIVKEPDKDSLYEIIDNVIENYENITGVNFDEEKINKDKFIKKLIELTDKSHRNYVDIEYNPGLVISIVRKAFSYAMYYEHDDIEIGDINEAVNKCGYLYEPIKEKFVSDKSLSKIEDKNKVKVIEFHKKNK